ncbi:MAG: prephenate dehydratase, partial [Actinobacteria bacterium]|nr:prephenate dehydratase [Actinomycetota bacterium]
MARIAYLGPQGTFTEAAMLQLAADKPGFEPVACDSSGAAVEAVRLGTVDYACVPIENSLEGSVLPTMDSLSSGSGVQIFAEHTLDVAFSIVVRPGVAADAVSTVAAFPVAAAQVRRWLAEQLPRATLVPAISNAGAAQQVSEGVVDAGVSTALAAARWGLDSLADGVVDEPNARTRFVLVGRPGPPPPRTGADRTSVVLRLRNEPGALVAAMTEFSIRDIDLTRIESRPTRTELG